MVLSGSGEAAGEFASEASACRRAGFSAPGAGAGDDAGDGMAHPRTTKKGSDGSRPPRKWRAAPGDAGGS